MPARERFETLERHKFYSNEISLATARTFDKHAEPDLKIKCNTFVVVKNDVNDLDIAFSPEMMDAPIPIDIHGHDNLVIFRGNFAGIWIQHAAAAGKELTYIYGDDIYIEHQHKHVHTYTEVTTETTTNLAAAAVYTGSWLDLNEEGYTYIILTAFADKNLTLAIEQSHNGVTVHRSDTTTYTASATSGNMLKVQVMMRYVRVKVTNNDAAITTTLTVQRRYSQA